MIGERVRGEEGRQEIARFLYNHSVSLKKAFNLNKESELH